MDENQAKALRAPFDKALISLLPKVNCKACTDNKREKHCDRHQMVKCRECGAWITTQHIHLSYVGHAETTDRFLDVDPEWTWEPMAFDSEGLPKLDRNGGLWMRLTIAGVTRPAYGDSQGKDGPNAVKEAIGDGLRNGGMRFGVALDLWAKSDLAAVHADKETGEIVAPSKPREERVDTSPGAPHPNGGTWPGAAVSDEKRDEINRAKRRVKVLGDKLGMDVTALAAEFNSFTDGGELRSAGLIQLQTFADDLERQAKAAVPA